MRELDAMLALELEVRYKIEPCDWDSCTAPDELIRQAKDLAGKGLSTVVAYHPEEGWFGVLYEKCPFIWWSENLE